VLLFALVGLVGVYLLLRARHARQHVEVLADLPAHGLTESLRATGEGPVAVVGRAAAYGTGPLEAPASGRPCVWWALRAKPHARFMSRRFTFLAETTSPHPFALTDGTQQVRVDPDRLMSYGPPHCFEVSEKQPRALSGSALPPVTQRVRSVLPDFGRDYRWGIRRVDFTEWLIEEGERITITGALEVDEPTGERVLRAHSAPGSRRKIFSVTPGDNHNAVDDLRRAHRRGVAVGLGFVVLGAGFLLLGVVVQLQGS
jgi:hypothetical protein